MADSAFDLKPSATALKPSVSSGGNTAFDLTPKTPAPAPKPVVAVKQPEPGFFSDERSPVLNSVVDFLAKSPQLLESTPDQNIISRIASPIAKAGAGLVGFPAQVVGAVQDELQQPQNPLLSGDQQIGAAVLKAADKLLFQPGRDVRAKADQMDIQAANDPSNAPVLNSGANTLRRLSILPFAGPAIAEDANKIAEGDTAGGVTDVGAQALMMGLGAQGKGEADLKAARVKAINDLADAHLEANTQAGTSFNKPQLVNGLRGVSTQDILDTAKAQREANIQNTAKAQALADAKSRMAQGVPEVAPTDVLPEAQASEVQPKIAESSPAVPAGDLKAAEKQAAKVQNPAQVVEGTPTEGSPTPALISDEERAHLEQKGFTVDSQGRLARLVQSRASNPEAGQAALEPEVKPTPVFTPEPPAEPKGLLNAANVTPDVKEPVSTNSGQAISADTVPGNDPTPEAIAALKAKNGIADVPSEKVGAKLPKPTDEYFSHGSYLDYGFKKMRGGMDMGMSDTRELSPESDTLSPHQRVQAVNQWRTEMGKSPVEFTNDGKIVLYHGTDSSSAARIAKNGASDGLFLSAQPEGDFSAKHYGDKVLRFEVDPRNLVMVESTGDFVLNDVRKPKPVSETTQREGTATASTQTPSVTPLAENNVQGLKTNLLKNRNRETGAVRPDLLVGAPAEVISEAAKKVGEVASEGRGLAAAAGEQKPPSTEPLPKYAGSINLEKLATPDDVKRQVLDTYEANQKTIDKARKPNTSFEQTKKAALDLGWSEKDVIKAQKKGALDSAQIQAARQVTLAANEDVVKANKAYAADPSTQNLIARAEALSRSATVNQAMQGASAEAGRALNAHKILAEALRQSQTDTQRAMEIIRKGLGDKWAETQDAVTKALAAIPEGDTASMNKLIRNYSKFTTPNKVFAYYNANLLSGIQTNVKNHFLSRVVSMGMEDLTRTVAGLLDPAMAKIQGRPREFYAREGALSLLARADGVQDGYQNAMQILKHGVTESQAQDLGRSRRFEFTGWASGFNIPGRLAEASVALFKSMSVSGELKALAVRQGLKEKLSGSALDARAKELLANPTDEMVQGANAKADQINFTSQPGTWTKSFIEFRNSVPPLKFVTPFVNIPMNIMKAGFEFSPAGYLKLPRESAMGLFGKMTGDAVGAERLNYWKTPEAADAFARASIGTAVALYAASKYENGELTGKAPADRSGKDQFLRQHPEYSVKVNGRWLKYTDFGPLMVPFMTAAAIKDAQQTHANFDAASVAYQAIGTLGNGILQQSFYKGMNDTAQVFGGNVEGFKGSVVRTGAGLASGFIPGSGLLHSTKNIADTTLRDPDGIYERIKSGLPWLSNSVPSKLNALGDETQGSRLSGIFGMGLRTSKVPDADIEKELAKTGVAPSLPSTSMIIGSTQFELTRDQKREFTDLAGQARKQTLRQLFADQQDVTLGKGSDRETLTYSQMDDEQKAKAIRKTVEDADSAARDEFVNRVNARKEPVKEKPKKAKLLFQGVE